ncbi:hypothetical protein, partial [Thalassospira alkalitolerans]|uniref:hypothetical protein n=1 Tax=Thalassospira alkalitolerans TaxID=1293890 RepID=UPI003AA7F1D9
SDCPICVLEINPTIFTHSVFSRAHPWTSSELHRSGFGTREGLDGIGGFYRSHNVAKTQSFIRIARQFSINM